MRLSRLLLCPPLGVHCVPGGGAFVCVVVCGLFCGWEGGVSVWLVLLVCGVLVLTVW